MQESTLGMQPRALVGKWDTGFAVGVGMGDRFDAAWPAESIVKATTGR